jgi:hypothetical protein
MDIIKCYDKYNQLLKEGDYVDVQKDGVHQIYKKADGQLYFAPYGEEDRVSAYFSNDIAKCDKDGCWINNDRYEEIEDELDPLPEFELKKDIFDTLSSLLEPKQYPIGGFAPGSYWCNCVTCKEKFMGDKKAVQCEPCAIEMVNIKVKINEQGGIETVKEDTVEAAAEEYFLQEYSWNGKDSLPYKEEDVKLTKENFIAGAKWQAKRMYSEADNIMKFLDTEVELKLSDKKTIERIKWYFETYFEQFKKK